MVVARHGGHDHIHVLILRSEPLSELIQLCNELRSVVLKRLLDGGHLEIERLKLLIAEVFLHCIGKSAFATAWDAGDKHDRNQ